MPTIVSPRPGSAVTIKSRAIPFSFHPVTRSTRRYGLQSRIFATNPWGIIRQSIEDALTGVAKVQSLAFLEQAENFYACAKSSSIVSAKPLLFYYCFLNLAKAFVILKGVRSSYEIARHGLQEAVHPHGVEFSDSFVKAFRSSASQQNVFDDLRKAIGRPALPGGGRVYELKYLGPQLLQGHRVWCEAANERERFVELHDILLRKDDSSRKLWISLRVVSDDLTRFGITHKKFLAESGLASKFREVRCGDSHRGSTILEFEQKTPISFTSRASDKVKELVDDLKPYIWTTVTIVPPYRKNYAYLCPSSEAGSMMPQPLSIYAYFYYLGSITRYRPHLFDNILQSRFGAHIQEIVSNLPQQFLYMLASEFSNREIAHAPIVS